MDKYTGQDFPILFDAGPAADIAEMFGDNFTLTPYRLILNSHRQLIVGPGGGMGAEVAIEAISRLYPATLMPTDDTFGLRWHGDTMSYDTSAQKRLAIAFREPQDFYQNGTPRPIKTLIVSLYSPHAFAEAIGLPISPDAPYGRPIS